MGRFSGPELLFWVSFWKSHYFYGSIFGAIIVMGLFLSGNYFLGSNLSPDDLFCLLKLKFHYFYGYLFGRNYFYGSFFARQIIFFGTGKISGAGHPRHFGILTTPRPEERRY